MRLVPPFRADHVGSFLRPAYLKQARAERAAGTLSVRDLSTTEDHAISDLIAKQESLGLRGITDGEYRRAFWHLDFFTGLDGIESYLSDQGIQFKGGQSRPQGLRVAGKIGASQTHFMLDAWKYVAAHTKQTAKITIPSPTVLHYRGGRKAVSTDVYPDMDGYFDDLGNAFKKIVRDFGDAGCRYLQLDEVNLTYLCDQDQRKMLSDRGDDPDQTLGVYRDLINTALSAKHPETRVTMHLCRGNFKSMWIAEGGYEPVADVLFNQINADGYFMEWDTDRAGNFEPLRLVPKGKQVVLGLVTTKTGELESKDNLKRRIDTASKYIDLDQLCLSPQCGFASTEEGNILTEDQQWAKLARVVEVAHEVWGEA